MKKGISMITLMVTILVLAIITTIVVLNVSDTDLINNATSTVNNYNDRQYEIFELVKDTQQELEELETKKKEIIYNGSLTGVNGVIELPLLLNDTSKQYILDIESNMYTGQVLLNMYMLEDMYIGATGINVTSNYAIEFRHLMLESKGGLDAATMEGIFGTADIQPLIYTSDGSIGGIQYNLANIGSEVTIKRITRVDREYTMFANLLKNLIIGNQISAYDMKEALLFCINSNLLGYDFLNEQLQKESTDTTIVLDEKLEMQTLKNIVNTRVQDLNDIEYSITDQTFMMAMGYVTILELPVIDFYTIANIFEENEFLNEYYYRAVGNTAVPFTLLFADEILLDLNEDGLLGTYDTNSMQALILATGNAGVMYRSFADIYATLYPLTQKYGAISEMPAMDQLKFQEVVTVSGMNSNGTTASTAGQSFYVAYIWALAHSVYTDTQMDTMYSLMHQNGITINMAGLKMGWNSIISEALSCMLNAEMGFRISPTYDFRMDSDAINRQGVRGIQDQLYEYISAVQQGIREEYTKNAEE